MASLKALVDVVAEVEHLDPATVSLIAREVREAGLIKTGGRGTSAAQMSFTDAANLLIAVNTSSIVREAPRAIKLYRNLQHRDENWELWTNFGDALERLLEATAEEDMLERFLGGYFEDPTQFSFISLQLTFFKPYPSIQLSIKTHSVVSNDLRPRLRKIEETKSLFNTRFDPAAASAHRPCDRSEETTIGLVTIQTVANLIAAK